MTKQCKQVLNNLRKLSKTSEETLAFLGGTDSICLISDHEHAYDYSKFKNEIQSIIKQLVNDGYIEYAFNEYHFSLTQKGLHPYRFGWDTIKKFLIKSVVVPIVVSILTTLFISLL